MWSVYSYCIKCVQKFPVKNQFSTVYSIQSQYVLLRVIIFLYRFKYIFFRFEVSLEFWMEP